MILITRPLEEISYLQGRLRELGIETLLEPLFVLQPLSLDVAVLADAKLIVSSKNAIRALLFSDATKDLSLYAMSDGIAEFARSNGFYMTFSCGCGTAEELEAYVLSKFCKNEKIIYLSGSEISRDIIASCVTAGFKLARRQICYIMHPIVDFSIPTRTALQDGKIKGIALLSPLAAMLCSSLLTKNNFEIKHFSYFVMSQRIASVLDCDTVYVSASQTIDALVDVIGRHYHVRRRI